MDSNKKTTIKKRKTDTISAVEKCEAVLSVWAERRKPAQVCQEMGIQWVMLNHWQNRALDAMLEALEPRRAVEKTPKLNTRLEKLLRRHIKNRQRELIKPNLDRRLQDLQKSKEKLANKS